LHAVSATQKTVANTDPELPMTQQIGFLAAACQREGYRLEVVDHYSGQLARVHDGQKNFLVGAGSIHSYPINNAVSMTVARDKAYTYSLLADAGIQVPEGGHFFLTQNYRAHRPDGREIADALDYARALGFPVFVKPNDGSRGDFAELIREENALLHHLTAMGQRYHCGLVQRVVHGEEYRVFVLDGEVQFHYRKAAATLVGDGAQSIGDLLAAANAELVGKGISPVAPDSFFLQGELERWSMTLESVPARGQRIAYTRRANLSGGGELTDFTLGAHPRLAEWATRVAGILGLRVCGIDVMADGGLADPDRFTVMEVNGNPALAGAWNHGKHELVIDIWARICRLAFAALTQTATPAATPATTTP
jgi:glutathione synthase/RimK-type ligase-like ATP-grasp enzyme